LTREYSFTQWVGLGIPLLLLIGLLIMWGLHVRLRLPITELAIPVMGYVGVQILFFVGMFWAGRLARKRNDYKAAIALGGGYCWGSGILVLYYGNKWGLLTTDNYDYALFSVLITIAVVFIAVVARFIVPSKESFRP
jgi:hypothetical protein